MWTFWDAILWMKNVSRDKQISSTLEWVKGSYPVRFSLGKVVSARDTKQKIVFRECLKMSSEVTFEIWFWFKHFRFPSFYCKIWVHISRITNFISFRSTKKRRKYLIRCSSFRNKIIWKKMIWLSRNRHLYRY